MNFLKESNFFFWGGGYFLLIIDTQTITFWKSWVGNCSSLPYKGNAFLNNLACITIITLNNT